MKIIEILVSPAGQVRIETRGFAGGECRQASRFVEEALGRAAEERLTPEFYHEQTERQDLREGAG